MNNCEVWCEDLKKYWQSKQIDKIIDLFDSNVLYYETPRKKLNSFDDLKALWEEIKEQKTDNIGLKVLCISNNKCIANYILNDVVSYDMIYEIELNKENKCIYFKQWYMEF